MRLSRRLRLLLLLVVVVLAGAACAPQEATAPTAQRSTSGLASSGSASARSACAPNRLPLQTTGKLTIGTDDPAYLPWYVNDDPTNGKGYESAVAYAVARRLGFTRDQVTWVTVPFNTSYKPGAKSYDFDINQISITPERARVVDFSNGYYTAAQAVIALKGSALDGVTSLAALASYRLGAQTGTTSLTAIREVVKPKQQPLVFEDTNAAKQALLNGQVDGIVADLPTAFFIISAELKNGVILGQFQQASGVREQFGMLFEKGSGLVPCVNRVLAGLKADGTVARLEKRWLADVVDVPVLR